VTVEISAPYDMLQNVVQWIAITGIFPVHTEFYIACCLYDPNAPEHTCDDGNTAVNSYNIHVNIFSRGEPDTGSSTVLDYFNWPQLALFLIMFIMCFLCICWYLIQIPWLCIYYLFCCCCRCYTCCGIETTCGQPGCCLCTKWTNELIRQRAKGRRAIKERIEEQKRLRQRVQSLEAQLARTAPTNPY
jgi:hypothetical protein